MNLFRLINSKNSRTKLVKQNIIASLVLKGFSVLISFILVPLTLDYLNEYEYGIWLTLNSVLSWVYIFDIGLGNGLRNKLAESLAKKDYQESKIYVSTSFFCMTLIALFILSIFFLTFRFIDWYKFLNVSPEKVHDLGGIISIVGGVVCLTFVLKLVGNIYMAYQQPSVNNLLTLLGSFVSLVIIYILTKTTEGSLKAVAITFTTSAAIVYLLAVPITFHKYREISPSLSSVKIQYVKNLTTLGVNFMIIQIAVLVLFMSSNIIISKLFGPEEVTPYNIAFKYFSVANMVFAMILTPIWSAVTDAKTRGDYEWIKKTLSKMIKIWCLLIAGIIIMLIFSNLFYNIWVGKEVTVPFKLSFWMAIYIAITTLGNLYAYIINGFGKLRLQLIYGIIQAAVYIPLAIICGKIFGVTGILIALSLVCLFSTAINHIQCRMLINRTATGIWDR